MNTLENFNIISLPDDDIIAKVPKQKRPVNSYTQRSLVFWLF